MLWEWLAEPVCSSPGTALTPSRHKTLWWGTLLFPRVTGALCTALFMGERELVIGTRSWRATPSALIFQDRLHSSNCVYNISKMWKTSAETPARAPWRRDVPDRWGASCQGPDSKGTARATPGLWDPCGEVALVGMDSLPSLQLPDCFPPLVTNCRLVSAAVWGSTEPPSAPRVSAVWGDLTGWSWGWRGRVPRPGRASAPRWHAGTVRAPSAAAPLPATSWPWWARRSALTLHSGSSPAPETQHRELHAAAPLGHPGHGPAVTQSECAAVELLT